MRLMAGQIGADRATMLDVAGVLLDCSDSVVDALTEVATYRSAVDELHRSIKALAGASWEIDQHRPPRLRQVAIFHPSNNLLYSYVLYGVIPTLFSDSLLLRPSSRAAGPVRRLHELINSRVNLPISLIEDSQRDFLERARRADLVAFTGEYDNALAVAHQLSPQQLLLFFGSGLNPMVVGPEADLEQVVQDSVRARLYNSGSDCLCPDVIFVHASSWGLAQECLKDRLASVVVGRSRSTVDAEVAPIYYVDVVPRVFEYFKQWRERIIFGGQIDVATQLIMPTVLASNLGEQPPERELFAPVFNLVRYEESEDVLRYLLSAACTESAMYLSVYGEPAIGGLAQPYTTCQGEMPLDVENGNRPFGGYGVRGGFAQMGLRREGRPLLISAEVARMRRGWSP